MNIEPIQSADLIVGLLAPGAIQALRDLRVRRGVRGCLGICLRVLRRLHTINRLTPTGWREAAAVKIERV
jgi:hypothetical protein